MIARKPRSFFTRETILFNCLKKPIGPNWDAPSLSLDFSDRTVQFRAAQFIVKRSRLAFLWHWGQTKSNRPQTRTCLRSFTENKLLLQKFLLRGAPMRFIEISIRENRLLTNGTVWVWCKVAESCVRLLENQIKPVFLTECLTRWFLTKWKIRKFEIRY